MIPPVQGLCPFFPSPEVQAPALWWRAVAPDGIQDDRLCVKALEETHKPGSDAEITGVCAPLSVPAAFAEHLGLPAGREESLRALTHRSLRELRRQARVFARSRAPGQKHPLRGPGETRSALAPDRLRRFRAAVDLLKRVPAYPWTLAAPLLVEVDTDAFLDAVGVRPGVPNGSRRVAVRRRAAIVGALHKGAAGFVVDVLERDFAVASRHALEAVVGCAAAAAFRRDPPSTPAGDVQGWWLVPRTRE